MSGCKNVCQQWERIQQIGLAYYRPCLFPEMTGEFIPLSFSGMFFPASRFPLEKELLVCEINAEKENK